MQKQERIRISLFYLSPYLAVFIGLFLYQNAFLAIFLYHSFIAYPILRNRTKWIRKFSFPLRNPGLLFMSISIGLASGPVILLLWHWMVLPGLNMSAMMESFGLSGQWRFLFLLYFTLFHPFWEEAFWRFIPPDKIFMPLRDLSFAAYHLLVLYFFLKPIWFLPALILLWVTGIIWRWMCHKEKNPLALLLSHVAADFSIITAVFFYL